MAFKLTISDTVTVPVKGAIPNAAGVAQPFAFSLVCRRITQEQLMSLGQDKERSTADFLAEVTQDWSGVLGDDDRPVPYTPAALAQLLDIVGMAGVAFAAYIEACGAQGRGKN